MPRASIVNFFFWGAKPTLGDRLRLKKFIIFIFKKEKQPLESVNIVFSNDAHLHRINNDYLAHDYPTDIVTFDLSERSGLTTAELYISCERVKENARSHDSSFRLELHRVVFHGVLHLCGYQDKTKKQSANMREREDYYLAKYFE